MKKVLSALLIMLMLIQTAAFAAGTKVYSEEDTKLLVDKLSVLGIFDQFDNELFFAENAGIKRYEAAVVISNMLGMGNFGEDDSFKTKFHDVPFYCDYKSAVTHLANLGVMTGDSAGLFRPDETMEIVHVYKALVVALGYGWKADAYGGYPAGYVKVAAEIGIADVVSKGINDTATRIDLLKMVDAALYVPICRIKSISGDKMDFEIDEDVTALSEYHSIYEDKGIVENNKTLSIGPVIDNTEDVVYIGGRKLYVNGVIDIYSYLGCEVEYYYAYNKKEESGYLLYVALTADNTETKISKVDFAGFADNKITYYNESGKEKSIKLSGNVVVLYNGEITIDVPMAINNFEGTLTLIDNNNDNQAEVVIAKNYTYDKIKSVKTAENKIYTTNNGVISFGMYENVEMFDGTTGESIGIANIKAGDIIGYIKSSDGTKLSIDVINSGMAVKVKSITQDSFTTVEGQKYDTSLLRAEHKALIKPNAEVSVMVIDGYYAVWVSVESETVSIGYLINVATETEFGQTTILGARILDTSGEINAYKTSNSKKVILNGKSTDAAILITELARIKAEYSLGGDGAVAQCIAYKLDAEGNLSHIYTVDNDNEDSTMYLKFGFGRHGAARFYGTGNYGVIRYIASNIPYDGKVKSVHDYYKMNYMVTDTHPIFQVPLENQETAGKEWYGVKKFTNRMYNGESQNIESFTANKTGIVPKALVQYLSSDSGGTGTFNVYRYGKVVLIDSTYQTMNDDEGVDFIVKGFKEGTAVEHVVDGTVVAADVVESKKADPNDPNEEAGFTTGDIAVVQLDTLEKIIQIEKIFDRETGNITSELSPDDTGDEVSAFIVHAYNKPADGYGLEFFEEDLSLGVPRDDRKLLFSLQSIADGRLNEKANTFMFFDGEDERVYLGSPLNIIDYLQDPENYTKVFVIHRNSAVNVVFYNYYNIANQ